MLSKNTLSTFSGLAALLISGGLQAQQKNVLFIAVDDLKPLIGAYGDKHAKTPGLDRLAREGIIFQNCYCQQAICAATRASLLTGMRPDKTRVWDLVTDFRQVNPNSVSLPQYFKLMGYETAGMGKIFHKESTGPGHDAPSWSVPYRDAKAQQYALPSVRKANGKGPSVECADVPDETYHDGKLTGMAIQLLDSLSRNSKPFFLAVGYVKPHLPFVAPKKYWDLYRRNQFELAPFQEKAKNSPDVAYHASGELKSYSDIPSFNNYSENELDHLSAEKQRELIHGYYAAVSYLDAQVVQLLDELDRLKIRENTIIVLWGDHGWHLGDHGLWNKHTNFEQATRVPLMISIPGKQRGVKATGICEYVDIFPTLCELNRLPVPEYLDGISLVPAINNPEAPLREYALSQYPRGKDIMGYSIRTNRFRYTEWFANGFLTNQKYEPAKVIATEMYDYQTDPLETENLAENPKHKQDKLQIKRLFNDCMKQEFKSCKQYSELADYHEAQYISSKNRKNKIKKNNQ
jgi:arylsulfatase A-like enzyme